MTRFAITLLPCLLCACASVDTMPLSQDSFALTSTGLGGCGARGAERVAFQQAAATTLRKGYDRFVVAQNARDARLDSASSMLWTAASGGMQFNHTYSQNMQVKMFREDDPAGANAISAREVLGPHWHLALNPETTYECDMF